MQRWFCFLSPSFKSSCKIFPYILVFLCQCSDVGQISVMFRSWFSSSLTQWIFCSIWNHSLSPNRNLCKPEQNQNKVLNSLSQLMTGSEWHHRIRLHVHQFCTQRKIRFAFVRNIKWSRKNFKYQYSEQISKSTEKQILQLVFLQWNFQKMQCLVRKVVYAGDSFFMILVHNQIKNDLEEYTS